MISTHIKTKTLLFFVFSGHSTFIFFPSPCSLVTPLWPHSLPYLLHPHRTFDFPFCMPPWPLPHCGLHSGGLEPRAFPAGTKTAAVERAFGEKSVHQTLFSVLHFILLTLYFTPLLPAHPSHLLSTIPFGTGDTPSGLLLHPSLDGLGAFHLQLSQAPLKPHSEWQPETSVPTAGSNSKKGPDSVNDSEKKPRGSCWGWFSVEVNFSDVIHQICLPVLHSKFKKYI